MEYSVMWDYRVVLDLFLGGMGVGIYILTAYLVSSQNQLNLSTVKWGTLLAPLLVIFGAGFLMMELGKPFKMMSIFLNFNPTSLTAWGGLIQMSFIIISLTTFWLIKQRQQFDTVVRNLFVVGGVFAVLLGFYHGTLLTTLGRGIWANAMLPIIFFLSSLLAGGGFFVWVKKVILHKSSVATANKALEKYIASLSILILASIGVWMVTMVAIGSEVILGYQALLLNFGWLWWSVVIIGGIIAPLLIICYYLTRKIERTNTMTTLLAILLIVGSYTLKYIIVYVGQYINT